MSKTVRIAMLGTGDFAVPTFLELLKSDLDVVALVTQPDRPQGRKQELIPASIKLKALEAGIPVQQPESINDQAGLELVRSLGLDLLVTAAYGQILSAEVLAIPRLSGINLHGSILPKYRGAAPVARAIQNGETEAGVTVIQMTPKVDAGGMIAFARTKIDPEETAGELEARIATLGAPLIIDCIKKIDAGTAQIIPQDPSLVSKAPKLRKEDGLINWEQTATVIHNLIRAMQPWPMASTYWHPTESDRPPVRWIVHRSALEEGSISEGSMAGRVIEGSGDRLIVGAGKGAVRLLTIQVPGKKPMAASEFLRGNRVNPGDRVGPV